MLIVLVSNIVLYFHKEGGDRSFIFKKLGGKWYGEKTRKKNLSQYLLCVRMSIKYIHMYLDVLCGPDV